GSSLRVLRARFPAMWATPLHAPVTTFVPGSSVPARPDRPAFLRAVRFPEPEAGEVVLVAMSLILGRYCAPAQQIRRIRRATAGLRRRDFPRQVRCGTKTGSSAVSSAGRGDRTGPRQRKPPKHGWSAEATARASVSRRSTGVSQQREAARGCSAGGVEVLGPAGAAVLEGHRDGAGLGELGQVPLRSGPGGTDGLGDLEGRDR